MIWRKRLFYLLLLMLLALSSSLWMTSAQDGESTAEPPQQEETEPPPAIRVTRAEPRNVTSGDGGTLSVFGENFTPDSRVRLVGHGVLETQFINATTLTATIPASITPGEYAVEVSDAVRGSDRARQPLRVNPPPPPPPDPTLPPDPTAIPTEVPIPTLIPGQPSLMVRSFTASPSSIPPGGTTTITFEVVNQGNRPAQGVFVSLDPSGKFAPANGQSGATLPDIGVGSSASATLTVIAAEDTPPGPAAVPLVFSFFDFEGTTGTSSGSLSVNIQRIAEASQVTLARYLFNPNPVEPGEPVTVTVLVTNTGNETANQVLLRVGGEGSILLAGPQGDSFPLGDIAPGGSASLDLPLVVKSDINAGPQPQPVTLSFLQNAERQDVASSMTVNVAEVIKPEAVLLLDSYDVGAEVLQPGDRFTLSALLKNVGDADATNMLVTFGTVEETGDSGNGGDGGSDTTGGSTSTTPSTTFAPLGAGGTLFIGTVAGSGGTYALEQEFIVNGTVDSGIYSLPVTLRYLKPDGSTAQDNLRASIVVIAPPLLRANLQSPLPEPANTGEPFPVAIELINNGAADVRLERAEVTANNAEVIEGAETLLAPLNEDEDTIVQALVMPNDEGAVQVTVTLHYIDDLNQPDTIVLTYDTEAVTPPPPPPVEEFPPDFVEVPTEEPEEEDMVGRLLLGLLGLGS